MKFRHLEKIQSLALVGATGLVGREFLEILSDHKIKIPNLKLLASESSAGEMIETCGIDYMVEQLTPESFKDIEVAFFSVPAELSREYIPKLTKGGCTVIDDSSAFRMDKHVPLVVPQINGSLLKEFESGCIAIPNCTTTPLVMALKPLADEYGIKRIVVSTYQAVSGAGKDAFEELTGQTIALMNGETPEPAIFPHRIAFNCLPMIGPVTDNGNSEEEEKIVKETRKILGLTSLKVSATSVRVPTFCGHGLSVNVEMKEGFESVEGIRKLLEKFEGIQVIDKPESHVYPTNVEGSKSDPVFIGRVRRDHSVKAGLNLWIMCDNLRKGAALNAIEIMDELYRYRRLN